MYCAILDLKNDSYNSLLNKEIAFTPVLDLFINSTTDCEKRIVLTDVNFESTDKLSFVSSLDTTMLSCDTTLYINGLRPVVSSDTISKALEYHKSNNYDITILTATNCTDSSDSICNGIYFCKTEMFDENGVLTDEKNIGDFEVENSDELINVCDAATLLKANESMQKIVNQKLLDNGVFLTSSSVYIAPDVIIGKGTTILPNTIIKPGTKIGSNCVIGPNTQITNSTLEDEITVNSSVILDSEIGSCTTVGPFAYIRPNSKIASHVKLGDFVEIKNSTIDEGTKVSHLTYVGDCDVGKKVNFGCGTVLVNYDGKYKYRSKIGDNAFIGCNTNLVSPVTVEDYAFIAAGSTITDDVPNNTLAIARARQVIKENWKRKK